MLQTIFRTSSRVLSFNSCLLSRPALVVEKPRLHKLIRLSTYSGLWTTMSESAPKYTNRLAQEKSPYLLQHAHNPVDWYPWGDEAIQKAKDENKLIFLSIGYSTCHWCHVMERESFEDEETAKIMNENFVNIKVDREERPDIDKIYMNFLLIMNGSGGWPMSVWLTPDLAPITAGTYFPPKSRAGYPGFPTILQAIAAKWATQQEEIVANGMKMIEAVQETLSERPIDALFRPDSTEHRLQEAIKVFKYRFDNQYGGFGDHPKFPEVSRINFIFHAYVSVKDEDVLNMGTRTLKKIGNGGIHDHVFGGFARYSVDRKWHVPHFEKMLYDQGQLLTAYANAYKLTRDTFFLDIADGIFEYIMKDLRHPSGGFYSGEDADSLPSATDKVKVEGAFYAWNYSEVSNAIQANRDKYTIDADLVFEIYCHHYDIRETGNVEPQSDPHGHLTGKNILIVRKSLAETCDKFNLPREEIQALLRKTNAILHEERNKRPRPHLDTKIITSWNGLVLSGLAKLADCGGEKRSECIKAAKQLYHFVRDTLFDKQRNTLLRSSYGSGDTLADVSLQPIDGFLDDYAFLIKGLIDYYKSTLDWEALQWAKELQDIQDSLFWDDEHGGYFYSKANSPNLIMRLKEESDGAEPCGNSVAARNLLLFSYYSSDETYREKVKMLFNYFATAHPFGYVLPEMMSSVLLHDNGIDLVTIVGPESDVTKRFVAICQSFFIPDMVIVRIDPDNPNTFSSRAADAYSMVNGSPTVYICREKTCQIPITEPDALEESFKQTYLARYA